MWTALSVAAYAAHACTFAVPKDLDLSLRLTYILYFLSEFPRDHQRTGRYEISFHYALSVMERTLYLTPWQTPSARTRPPSRRATTQSC